MSRYEHTSLCISNALSECIERMATSRLNFIAHLLHIHDSVQGLSRIVVSSSRPPNPLGLMGIYGFNYTAGSLNGAQPPWMKGSPPQLTIWDTPSFSNDGCRRPDRFGLFGRKHVAVYRHPPYLNLNWSQDPFRDLGWKPFVWLGWQPVYKH